MKWIECPSCNTEYKVLSDSLDIAQYCPFCGELIEIEDEEEQEDDDFDGL